jgi:FtsX-like permease family
MRLVVTVTALLRRRRAERGMLALLFVLVAVSSFVVSVGPRLLARSADDGLRYAVGSATPIQRNLQFSAIGQIPAQTGAPFSRVEARGDVIRSDLPASVRAISPSDGATIRSIRFNLLQPPNYATVVDLQYLLGMEDRIEYLTGRPPAHVATPADQPPAFEVAVSREAAEHIQVAVGDVLAARADPSDPLVARVFPRPTTEVELRVVGIFDIRDQDDPFWYGESSLARAAVGGTDERPIAFTSMVFAPDAYADLGALGIPEAYRWRFEVDPERLDTGQLAALLPDLRRLEADYASGAVAGTGLGYRTGLLDILETFEGRRATTDATLAVAAMGPIAVAAGAVGLVALIIVRRRRPALILARGRGASSGQLLVAQAVEGVLVLGPAAVLGYVLADLAIPARSDPPSAAPMVVVVVLATALLVVATWPLARRARRDLERDEVAAGRLTARRLVIEVTIIGVALAVTWLLRERTVAGGAIAADGATFDPFLAAAPVLVGLAVALLAIRLYPIPIRALAASAARRRDLVPVLGLRAIGRHPAAAYLPLLILTLTVGVGVFSSAIATTVDRGQVSASWQAVGADLRIEAPPGSVLRPEADPSSIDGVIAVAPAVSIPVRPTPGGIASSTDTRLHAVDPEAIDAIAADAPIRFDLPPIFRTPVSGEAIGTDAAPIPVVASTRVPNGWPARSVGDVLRLQVRGQPMVFSIVALADGFPGLPLGSTFLLAPLDQVVAGHVASTLRPNMIFVRGGADVDDRIHAALAGTPVTEIEVSRHAIYAMVHDDPLMAAVGGGFIVALLAAGAYAALAVVAVVALDAQRQARESAVLRTMGLSDRQMVGLTVVEHAPPVVLAIAIGVLLGLGIAWLLEPALGLANFIAPGAPVSIEVDGRSIVAVIAAIVVVVTVAIALSTWLARRLRPANVLRMGEP